MKRGLLGFPLLIFLTQVISAQFYSGYGRFSLDEFFSRIDPQTIILVLLFLVFFSLIFYALSRIFKDPYGQPNKGIAGTIAFAVTSLIIYGLYRTGFDLGSIFFNLGFSSDLLYPILAVVFLIVAVLLIRKLGFGRFLMIFGLFIILLTIFTDIFYEKGLVLIIGLVSLIVGLLLLRRGRRRRRGLPNYQPSPQWEGTRPSRERRRDIRDVKHEQKLDYKRQKAEQEYRRKLQKEEEKRQTKAKRAGGGVRLVVSKPPRGRFQYSQGMRRGGLKPTRGRFASKKAIERYARRFGTEAAKKRFG